MVKKEVYKIWYEVLSRYFKDSKMEEFFRDSNININDAIAELKRYKIENETERYELLRKIYRQAKSIHEYSSSQGLEVKSEEVRIEKELARIILVRLELLEKKEGYKNNKKGTFQKIVESKSDKECYEFLVNFIRNKQNKQKSKNLKNDKEIQFVRGKNDEITEMKEALKKNEEEVIRLKKEKEELKKNINIKEKENLIIEMEKKGIIGDVEEGIKKLEEIKRETSYGKELGAIATILKKMRNIVKGYGVIEVGEINEVFLINIDKYEHGNNYEYKGNKELTEVDTLVKVTKVGLKMGEKVIRRIEIREVEKDEEK